MARISSRLVRNHASAASGIESAMPGRAAGREELPWMNAKITKPATAAET